MLYLLYGKDTYRRDERLREIREAYRQKNPGALAETVIDGDDPDAMTSLSETLAQSGGLFESKSLIVARRLLAKIGEEAVEVLDAQDAAERSDVNVVLVEDEKPKATRGMETEHFSLLDDAARVRWVARYVRDKGPDDGPKKIGKKASMRLVELGPDLWRLAAEIEKVLAYAAGEETVTEAHIADLLDIRVEETVFPLSDGVCGRDPLLALTALARLTADGQDPDGLINYVIRESRQLLRAHAARNGELPDSPQQLFGAKPFVWRKRTAQAGRWDEREMPALSQRIVDLELAWKGGADKRLALEKFIIAAAPQAAAVEES